MKGLCMKKIMVITALFLLVASQAFAMATLTLSLTTTGLTVYGAKSGATQNNGIPAAGTDVIGKTSTGVGIGMIVDPIAGIGYSVETQHRFGSKAFASASDTTSLFQKSMLSGTVDTTTLNTGAASFIGISTWTTM
jgi:hypothetical protein